MPKRFDSCFEKQPGEQYYVYVDFLNALEPGELLQTNAGGATAKKIKGADGLPISPTDATSDIIGAIVTETKRVGVFVKGGEDKEEYKITVTSGATSAGNVLEHDLTMVVKEE